AWNGMTWRWFLGRRWTTGGNWKRPGQPYLLGAKDAVTRVAQTGQDVAVLVELAVDGRGVDGHVRVCLLHRGQAFGAGQQADELDRLGVALLEPVDGGDGRGAGGQHRVDHDDFAVVLPGRPHEVYLHRLQGLGVAVAHDVAHELGRHHACRYA